MRARHAPKATGERKSDKTDMTHEAMTLNGFSFYHRGQCNSHFTSGNVMKMFFFLQTATEPLTRFRNGVKNVIES